jgi:hypothetical protein
MKRRSFLTCYNRARKNAAKNVSEHKFATTVQVLLVQNITKWKSTLHMSNWGRHSLIWGGGLISTLAIRGSAQIGEGERLIAAANNCSKPEPKPTQII